MIQWDGNRQQFVAYINGQFIGACGYHQGQDVLNNWLKTTTERIARETTTPPQPVQPIHQINRTPDNNS